MSVKVISSIPSRKLVKQGCLAYLNHIRDVEVEYLSVECINVVRGFREMFPTDFHGILLDRDVGIFIDMEPGMLPHLHTSLFHGYDGVERA